MIPQEGTNTLVAVFMTGRYDIPALDLSVLVFLYDNEKHVLLPLLSKDLILPIYEQK